MKLMERNVKKNLESDTNYLAIMGVFLVLFLFGCIVIQTKVMALTNSSIECFNTEVLEENVTVYVDGNASTVTIHKLCPNGCDNVTNSCEPLEYEQAGMNFILLILGIVGMVLIYKFARRRR